MAAAGRTRTSSRKLFRRMTTFAVPVFVNRLAQLAQWFAND
jgi:hypothetical protein